jgi:hypothetical protein
VDLLWITSRFKKQNMLKLKHTKRIFFSLCQGFFSPFGGIKNSGNIDLHEAFTFVEDIRIAHVRAGS